MVFRVCSKGVMVGLFGDFCKFWMVVIIGGRMIF